LNLSSLRANNSFHTLRSQNEEDAMGRKLVIIGGGAGGASVAAEAKRRDPSLSVIMIEKSKYVSTAA
jgi:glycerol-3-phosphate dehydrogenase